MRLTIIKGDHHVYVDGLPLPIDCSDLPAGFHALQWYGTWGDVEIVDNNGHNVANIKITDLTPYQAHIDAWAAAKAALDAKAAASAAAAEKAKKAIQAAGGVSVIAN